MLRDRKPRRDHSFDLRPRLAQGGFDPLRSFAAGESEPQIAGPLRKRNDLFAHSRSDDDVLDERDGPRLGEAAYFLEHAAPVDGKHEDSRGSSLAGGRVAAHAERVARDQLLERHAHAEAQRATEYPADAARRDLQDTRAGGR